MTPLLAGVRVRHYGRLYGVVDNPVELRHRVAVLKAEVKTISPFSSRYQQIVREAYDLTLYAHSLESLHV